VLVAAEVGGGGWGCCWCWVHGGMAHVGRGLLRVGRVAVGCEELGGGPRPSHAASFWAAPFSQVAVWERWSGGSGLRSHWIAAVVRAAFQRTERLDRRLLGFPPPPSKLCAQ
jgi:hypothetical protein